ncbi:EAL domain-containing protein [Paludicola sp. MB14-C6]|uniref:EAL and HDOD domain-containing protein n=1 Tax=Paludihabitans sp. MB14-C6 TaxID=3070656 RepID=UPI0027DEA4D9|nr:EAL domain-containing protein [Paludicola sp. MB14-C6]WMJ24187.1 EAL domain-containing protein [Paludicola sp. MB14-C6]
MEVFVARQPILNREYKISAYELLYRDSLVNSYRKNMDGNIASMRVISDAITTFGLYQLTDETRAFINFTKDLIIEDYAYAFSPQEIVIELLEDMVYDEQLIQKIVQLSNEGYQFALDDYIGGPIPDNLLKYISIVKVDFRKCTSLVRCQIARNLQAYPIHLLAEKIETEEEYQEAYEEGYDYFQGYFFARPDVCVKNQLQFQDKNYMSIIDELQSATPNYEKIENSISTDTNLLARLLRMKQNFHCFSEVKLDSPRYVIALVGLAEIQKWIMLNLLRHVNQNKPSEIIKTTFTRAHVVEKMTLGLNTVNNKEYNGEMLLQTDKTTSSIIEELPFNQDMKNKLKRRDCVYADILSMITAYERASGGLSSVIQNRLHLDCNNESVIYS